MGLTIIAKITNRCNLQCPYCSVNCTNKGQDLSLEDFSEFCLKIKRIYNTKGELVEILFHGGEPTLVGTKKLHQYIQVACLHFYDSPLKFAMQSNLYEIPEEFLELTKIFNIHIGTSLDGGIETNTKANKEKTKKVLENIKKLKTGIICVVNKLNKNNYYDLYNTAKELKVSLKINAIYKSGRAQVNWNNLGISAEDYYNYLVNIFYIWYKDNSKYSYTLHINPISEFMKIAYNKKPNGCNFSDRCLKNFIEINANGKVTACGRLNDEENLTIAKHVSELLPQNVYRTLDLFTQRIIYLRNTECKDCKYWEFCYGGCPSEAEDFFNKTRYCFTYRKFIAFLKKEGFKMIEDKLKKYQKEFKKEVPDVGLLRIYYELKNNIRLQCKNDKCNRTL